MLYLRVKRALLLAVSTAFGIISWIDIYCMLTGIKMFSLNRNSWKFLVADALTCIVCAFLVSYTEAQIENRIDYDKWHNEGIH